MYAALKHTILLCQGVSYGGKSFITLGSVYVGLKPSGLLGWYVRNYLRSSYYHDVSWIWGKGKLM